MARIVLVVEDDESISKCLKQSLRYEGFLVFSAFDGREGLDMLEVLVKAKDNHTIIVLLDLIMPKMNGYDFLKECEKTELCKKVPIVIITATEVKVENYETIVKPFDLYQLIDVIKQKQRRLA